MSEQDDDVAPESIQNGSEKSPAHTNRRRFLKTAIATSALTLGSGTAAAQDNENSEWWRSFKHYEDWQKQNDPFYADPSKRDEYEYDLTYQHPVDQSEYRIYVDGEIVQSDWGYAEYNETVEGDVTDEYVVITAEADPDNVDGYFFDGELLAVYTEHEAVMWLGNTEIDPNDYPDHPDEVNEPSEDETESDSPDNAVVVSSDGSTVTAEAPDGTTYDADEVGAPINSAMGDGHREFSIESGTYTLDTRITAKDDMTLIGQDDPTFEITWGNTALSSDGTTYDIAVYTNPDAGTSDVTIDGIIFDAVEEPPNTDESQIIGDPRNVGTKYNWTIRNCEFHHAPKYAINMDNHENPTVESCRFYDGSYWWFGLHLRMHTVRNGKVINCYFDRNSDGSFPALRLDGFDTEVRGCEFDNINATGIDVVDVHVNHGIEFVIRDCQFSDNGSGTGIVIDHSGASNSRIEANDFADLEYGIREQTSGGTIQITDNTFSSVGTNTL